ncbi:hypothetical protein RJ640_028167 [Escallonia rubra]|uniref:UBL3-like ubiquitin domain-containing protein n=1 Tax=Escallonia rubra TaxID=112253 RepID=A0AA88U2I2_9ASTE|nr:hypothetical protein RJ640_028167 [Escallonia rubra]
MPDEELVELKFRLYDGSDIGPFQYSPASTVAMLKERIVAEWPKAIIAAGQALLSVGTLDMDSFVTYVGLAADVTLGFEMEKVKAIAVLPGPWLEEMVSDIFVVVRWLARYLGYAGFFCWYEINNAKVASEGVSEQNKVKVAREKKFVDKKIAPKAANDVKLISAGKILENSKTVSQCKTPFGELPKGIITMHAVVQPSLAKAKTEKKVDEAPKKNICACSIL